MHSEVAKRLRTLRRIPADVVLALGTREFEMSASCGCLCALTVVELMNQCVEREVRSPIERVAGFPQCGVIDKLTSKLGGTEEEWQEVNHSYYTPDTLAWTEEAFARRVAECAI